MTQDQQIELVKEVVGILRAEFDSVQIFVAKTLPEKQQTFCYTQGEGSFYERYGIINLWMRDQEIQSPPHAQDSEGEEAEGA